ncbi:SpoIIE family protein phosphatase [Nocardioides mangrovi]|uniref:SpoIIE family protein phosphatase n=1 Tax=Nocardioides mangrovi TaxID=2874580 RepID=A0ABS7UBL2_9ACTN|nr:SpoIIE family protein phosphatase [Nocardioides mangrovi]MBZ5738224.1 SpoIIE family protein phosphatase [Nocardioides mangrovi]
MSEPRGTHTPAYAEADLTTCDREPIHIPGAIQPHGILLALDDDLRAVMVSANVEGMLGVTPQAALGRRLADLVGAPAAEQVAARAPYDEIGEPVVALVADELCDVRVHRSGPRIVVEVEPVGASGPSPMSYQSARGAMARLGAATTLDDLVDRLAQEVRAVLGFDRVMVYRFDQDWNGEVVAEDRREDLNPFLGLHYPATDIPAQARRLYTVNWTRLIADIGYRPVPLHPVFDPADGYPLDLSHSTLRSVSPIHVEYLSNMGVTASMSVSLVIDDQLWGLIACHHYSGPHRPSHDARAAAEFLGQVSSQLVADRVRADVRERTLEGRAVLARMTARIAASDESPLISMMEDPELLSLVSATGAALSYDGTLTTVGTVPDRDTLERLAAALESPDSYATSTDRVSLLIPELADVAEFAGALRVGSAPDRWLLWVRPEQEQVVDWGGDPSNKLLYDAESPGVRLSPRKSFDKWRQVVRGRSLPWAPWKLEIADELGKYLIGLLLSRSREQIVMAESLQRSVVLERPPVVDGLEVAARYQPASTFQLGGDWWDVVDLTGDRVAFVVGDVAGHGVAAATAMTQVRTALRAYLFEGHGPRACVDQLDHLMAGLLDQRVATALVAVLDRTTGRIEIANAGHPPPLIVVPGGATEVDVPVRPLLGVGAGEAESIEIDLAPGETLLLYTDGLVERRGTDLRDRLDRLLVLAGETVGDDLEAWLDRLLAEHADGDDDTTVVAIRRT